MVRLRADTHGWKAQNMQMITDVQRTRLTDAIADAAPKLASGDYRIVPVPEDFDALTKEDAENSILNLRDLVPVGIDYRDKTGELWTVSDYADAARDGHTGPESLGL